MPSSESSEIHTLSSRVSTYVHRVNLIAFIVGVVLTIVLGALAGALAFFLEAMALDEVHAALVGFATAGGIVAALKLARSIRVRLRAWRAPAWRAELKRDTGASDEEIDDAFALFR